MSGFQLVRQLGRGVRERQQRPHDGAHRCTRDVRKRLRITAYISLDQTDALADVLQPALVSLNAHRATASLCTALAKSGEASLNSVTCTGWPRTLAISSSSSTINPT